MEAKGSRKIPEEGICASVGAKEQRGHFKSIKDLDHALIRKLAVITGVVIAADVFCIAVYVLLKKWVLHVCCHNIDYHDIDSIFD